MGIAALTLPLCNSGLSKSIAQIVSLAKTVELGINASPRPTGKYCTAGNPVKAQWPQPQRGRGGNASWERNFRGSSGVFGG